VGSGAETWDVEEDAAGARGRAPCSRPKYGYVACSDRGEPRSRMLTKCDGAQPLGCRVPRMNLPRRTFWLMAAALEAAARNGLPLAVLGLVVVPIGCGETTSNPKGPHGDSAAGATDAGAGGGVSGTAGSGGVSATRGLPGSGGKGGAASAGRSGSVGDSGGVVGSGGDDALGGQGDSGGSGHAGAAGDSSGAAGQAGAGGHGGAAVAVTKHTLIAGGHSHMCIVDDGRVYCWGANDAGQLGNGTTVDSASVVPVASLTDVASIAVGYHHSCAVRRDGTVACWGDGLNGKVSPATSGVASTPVVIPSLTDAVAVAAGASMSCAVRSNGQLACWGAPHAIPPGTSEHGWFTPADEALTDLVNVSAKDNTICAVRRNGSVVCATRNQVTEWAGITNAVSSTTGCAVLADGRVDCPGSSSASSIADAVSLSAGRDHACALRANGRVACWGDGAEGQLGDETLEPSLAPVDVVSLTDAVGVAAGWSRTCALRAAGGVVCWGTGNERRPTPTPIPVPALTDVTAVSAGAEYTCALRRGGSVACWGSGRFGNLGNDNVSDVSFALVPGPVVALTDARAISTGEHACALRTAGGLECWGNGASLGSADLLSSGRPVPVPLLADAVAVDAGIEHTCAVLADGRVACWGVGFDGRLGHGVADSSVTPVFVSSLTDAEVQAPSVAAGYQHSCVLRAGGQVSCWGDAQGGKLGNGREAYEDSTSTPVTVSSLSDAIQISASSSHTCAVRSGGGVVCWGVGESGQLGSGLLANSSTPIAVAALTDAVSVTIGGSHTCALRRGGSVACWGSGEAGALGNGLLADSSTPVAVAALTDAVSVSAGGVHSCAARANGSVVCWGDGLLGDGPPSWSRPQPIAWP
jgi:alpha-tubulin suppressor-like RCC1 family protein